MHSCSSWVWVHEFPHDCGPVLPSSYVCSHFPLNPCQSGQHYWKLLAQPHCSAGVILNQLLCEGVHEYAEGVRTVEHQPRHHFCKLGGGKGYLKLRQGMWANRSCGNASNVDAHVLSVLGLELLSEAISCLLFLRCAVREVSMCMHQVQLPASNKANGIKVRSKLEAWQSHAAQGAVVRECFERYDVCAVHQSCAPATFALPLRSWL